MSSRCSILTWMGAAALSATGVATFVSAQSLPPGEQAPSIVELSRQARADEGPGGAWVYTNDGRFRKAVSAPARSAPDVVAPREVPEASEPREAPDRKVPEAPEVARATGDDGSAGTDPADAAESADGIWRVRAGEDRKFVVPGDESFPFTVKLLAVTDPSIAPSEVVWSQASGPEPLGMVGSRSPGTTIVLHAAGHYRLRLSVTIGGATNTSDIEILAGPSDDQADSAELGQTVEEVGPR